MQTLLEKKKKKKRKFYSIHVAKLYLEKYSCL